MIVFQLTRKQVIAVTKSENKCFLLRDIFHSVPSGPGPQQRRWNDLLPGNRAGAGRATLTAPLSLLRSSCGAAQPSAAARYSLDQA